MYCGTNAKYCVNRKPVNLVCLTCVAKFTGEARAITGICSIMKQMDDYILFNHSVSHAHALPCLAQAARL